jgi:polysaccharide biosynthesis/export protein
MSCAKFIQVCHLRPTPGARAGAALSAVVLLALSPTVGAAPQTAVNPAPTQAVATRTDNKTGSVGTVSENPTTPAGYRIGAGDVLQISVWNEPGASVAAVVVRPDGKVTVPLVKETDVLGMTPAELEKVLADKLAQFIHGADVTVVVKEIHSKKVYLVGAVNKVGPVALLSQMTVLQALAEAGGLTDYAKRRKIYVLRNENGKQLKLPFNYDVVVKGEHIDQNVVLRPDDTIVVPH